MPHITNTTTRAFIPCALYAATQSAAYLDESTAIASTWGISELSKKQRDVIPLIQLYKQLQ